MVASPSQPQDLATRRPVTAADLVTLAGYAAGIWWSFGGPTWAAIASMAADELDGPMARSMGTAGAQGSALDWGADVALTPLALMRLGRAVNHPQAAVAVSPLVLAVQARMRAQGMAPPVGSARAAVMVATILIEMSQRNRSARPNPSRQLSGDRRARRAR